MILFRTVTAIREQKSLSGFLSVPNLPSQVRNGANEKPERLFCFVSKHNPVLVKARNFFQGGLFSFFLFFMTCLSFGSVLVYVFHGGKNGRRNTI
jgi:hypothetical protein